MNMKRWVASVLFCALLAMLPMGIAEAADGTLKVTFKFKDPTTGVEQNLNVGFIYLRNEARGAPMEKFFSKPDYIFGPSNNLNGMYSYTVPAGNYYIRILQRKVLGAVSRPYGPPEAGDLTWFQTTPITIVAGATLDLGTRYALPFSSSPVTITGTVKSPDGTPLAGHYVRAQTEQCQEPVNCTDTSCEQYGNQCGPTRFPAQQATDVDGNFTLLLADAGTYYMYSSPCLMAGHNQNDLIRCRHSASPVPVTVIRGDTITADIVFD